MTGFAQEYKTELLKTIDSIDLAKVEQAIDLLRDARDNSRRIFVCGNSSRRSAKPISAISSRTEG